MDPWSVRGLLLMAVLVSLWDPVGSFADGQIPSACLSMEPQHRGVAQTSPSPFQLTVSTMGFSPGDQIQVLLSGTSDFEGFMLQARDAANPGPTHMLGGFSQTHESRTHESRTHESRTHESRTHESQTHESRTQLLSCNNIKDSAVSHTSADRKREVVVMWTAPAGSPLQVQFLFHLFWVKVPGPIIYQYGFTSFPTAPQTKPTPTPPPVLPGPVTSVGCGLHKTCLQDPPGCDPEMDLDCFFWSMSTEEPTTVVFELSGPSDGYVAFALSVDTWMGDDDVYMCVKEGERVSVRAARTFGRSPPVGESQSVLSSVSWQISSRDIQCRFSRQVSLEPERFNLDQEYYLFLAHGPATNGEILYHSQQPLVSTQRKLLSGPPEVLTGSHASIPLKAHGALMMIAWMLTGSTGTFIASHFKSEWKNTWFQLHRGLMMLTLLLTTIAFCLPFSYRNGWSEDAGVHHYLGCTVLALSLLQPIVAAVRPPPGSDRRTIFKWTHFALGTLAEALAVAAMFLGMRQSSLLLPPAASFVLTGYSTWLLCARSFFLVLKYPHLKTPWSFAGENNREDSGRWVSVLRTLGFVLFVVGNSGFVLALLYLVAQV